MLIYKAYKFHIYPTKEQKILITKTIGSSRFVFNHFLTLCNDTYKKSGEKLSYNKCSAELTQLKRKLIWLKEVDSIALQSSLLNLRDALNRFYKKQ
ncbi:helix-turn-helix domain-containing protein, partial [Xenorhabdus sp. M]|nr:helix-turn-helix domain-containing protein [Xenorhabdus sp. M]